MGLGPSGSNAGDVSGFNSTPTFVETLVSEGRIDKSMFGVFISPLGETGVPEGTGEISFGGVDESRIRGDCFENKINKSLFNLNILYHR